MSTFKMEITQTRLLAKIMGSRIAYLSMLVLLLLGTFRHANAVISATTAYVIYGNKPGLTFNDGISMASELDELLSFTMPDGTGGTVKILPNQQSVVHAKTTWTFEQFVANVPADGNAKTLPMSYYYDSDGDLPHPINPVQGNLTATWSYNDNGTTKVLSASDLTGTFQSCKAPYTLTIKASDVKAQSRYGIPAENNYTDTTYRYTVNVADYKYCYAKPNQLLLVPQNTWYDADGGGYRWNTGNPTRTTTFGGGYYSSQFDPVNGFNVSMSPKFPTTGFAKAKFQLAMSNAQTDYTYQALENNATSTNIAVDINGVVTMNNKPANTVTIRATPIYPGYPAIDYAFTVNTWAVPLTPKTTYSTTLCGGMANQLIRSELTNSPMNNMPLNWSTKLNTYTRGLGGVFSEWGMVKNNYPDSAWQHEHYWTADVHSTGKSQYSVGSGGGDVIPYPLTNTYPIACRG